METLGLSARFIFSIDFCDFSNKGLDLSPEAPWAPEGLFREPPGDPQGTILDHFLIKLFKSCLH